MAERFKQLSEKHIEFINRQHLFFVATAPTEGSINLSPKGVDTLRVINPNRVVWLNLTGSGNETSPHVQENGRMTLMFCSFDKQPLILRIYGKASVVHPRDKAWEEHSKLFDDHVGARQFFELDVEQVLTSCGFGVPLYAYLGERETLVKWADKHGREGIVAYWRKSNQKTLDGNATNIFIQDETNN